MFSSFTCTAGIGGQKSHYFIMWLGKHINWVLFQISCYHVSDYIIKERIWLGIHISRKLNGGSYNLI